MLLGAYKINGTPINQLSYYSPDDLSGSRPYVAMDTLSADYADISSIDNWDKYGSRIIGKFQDFRDYKKLRSEIKTLVFTKASANLSTWNTLTVSEKEIAARYFLVPLTPFRLEVYTLVENIALGAQFHLNSKNSRKQRITQAVAELYNRLSMINALEVESELNQLMKGTFIDLNTGSNTLNQKVKIRTLSQSYEEGGREGSLEDVDGAPGLFDYVLSRTNTPFAGNGFSTKTYTVSGYTDCASFATVLIDILKDGKY